MNDIRNMKLIDFIPRSELTVPEHPVQKPKFPVIDAHNHLGLPGILQAGPAGLAELVNLLDSLDIRQIMNLDGDLDVISDRFPGLGLEKTFESMGDLRNRFIVFARLNWKRLDEGGNFGEKMAADLKRAAERGAQGVKIGKWFGLHFKTPDEKLIMPGDPRLDPVFETAGELGLPILYHVADPIAFFRPPDNRNERIRSLMSSPEWSFYSDEFPSFEELMDCQVKFVSRYPKTVFIAAHVASWAENLAEVGKMLDSMDNLYVDISARLNELGRQPRTAKKWFVRYADRILYGSDQKPRAQQYRVEFRILETEDEYFLPYAAPTHHWHVYGLGLPDDVLKKVYHQNAMKVIPGAGF